MPNVAPLETDVAIETPEHIVFRYRVAGPARRGLAYLLDLLLCYSTLLALAAVAVLAAGAGGVLEAERESLGHAGAGLLLVALFFVQWVYFVIAESRWGRSPGKAALALRVVTTEGRPIGLAHAALRNLLRAADSLPVGYALGIACMAGTRRFQRLGDLVAGTMVIHANDHVRAEPIRLWPPARPDELAALPERVGLDPEERAAIELFLRRRGRLGALREAELAQLVAPALGRRFDYRHGDPSRMLAVLYDRAVNAGREEAPPSSRGASPQGRPWR